MRSAVGIPILCVASLLVTSRAPLASANVKTVCTSGCDYASLQVAVEAVKALGSSASSPWVIRVEPGVLVEHSLAVGGADVWTVTIDDLSYLTIEGSGDFASIVRASPSFFSAAAALGGSTNRDAEHFITVKNSDHVTFRGVQIDAGTNVLVPGGGGSGQPMANNGDGVAGIFVENSNPVLIESSTVVGYQWGVRDAEPMSSPMTNRIDIYNSRIKSQHIAMWATGGTSWFIWSSDFESQGDLTANTPSGFAEGLYVTGAHPETGVNRVSAWGSYFHAATSNLSTNRGGEIHGLRDHDIVTITGCTLHGISTAPETVVSGAQGLYLTGNSAKARFDIVGSELIYEAPPAAPAGGLYSGIYNWSQMPVGVVGSAILDLARDEATGQQAGGTGNSHADIHRVQLAGGSVPSPVRLAGSRAVKMTGHSSSVPQALNTVELQAGTANLINGSGSVTLPVPLPGPNYRVVLSVNSGENVSVSNKTGTSFTISSSSATSASTVDWMVRF